MDSFDASKSELIHYWTDLGTESIEFTLAQARLYRNFPKFNIAFSPSKLKKGNVMAQSIVFRQFKDYFPAGTIHICNTSFVSAQSRRFIICKLSDQLFLGPDNGLFHLGFNDPDIDYYRINNNHFDKDPLGEIYIPAIQALIEHPQKPLNELFEPKTVMLKPFFIQPVVNEKNIRITCLYIDHQGSAYFNITKEEFEEIRKGRNVRFRMSTGTIYGIRNQAEDVDEGEIVAFFDWGNILKLTQNSGNFSKHLAIYENSQIIVEFSEPKNLL
jgi:S-adenosylmethionine hydrolase